MIKPMTFVNGSWIVWALGFVPVPWLLSGVFRGRITSAQACIFGIAGVPDIDQVEQRIFGEAHGRFHWNADGCVAELGDELDEEDQRPIFTLIDTLSMNLTTFRADKPPTILFVGGRERGMLRVLLCSYDIARRSLVKETVTRMDPIASTRLPRLDRFRFSVEQKTEPIQRDLNELDWNTIDEDDLIELPDVPEFISLD